MNPQKDVPLAPHTTFKLPTTARELFCATTSEEIIDFCQTHENFFILGGGSNIILGDELPLVLKIENKGIEIIGEDEDNATVKIASGEIWDDVVAWAVAQDLSGIEMLSAIPGTAGATPYQNVGAYGGEIATTFIELTAYDHQEKKVVTIPKAECAFGYRTSIFKTSHKGRYVIVDITLRLSKYAPEIPNYPDVVKYFVTSPQPSPAKERERPTLQEIRNAIIEIRWKKLPKPDQVPNCGSFFENPIVPIEVAEKIKKEFPELKTFPAGDDRVKISAGFLIEHAGQKGKEFGRVGTYEKNALVLINRGEATQADVIYARDSIIEAVRARFQVELRSEPEIV